MRANISIRSHGHKQKTLKVRNSLTFDKFTSNTVDIIGVRQ